jgi:hypothetical protein
MGKKAGKKSNSTKAAAGSLPTTPFAAAVYSNDLSAIEAHLAQLLGSVTVLRLTQQVAEQFTSGHSTPVYELELSGPLHFIVKLVSVAGSDARAVFRRESYEQVSSCL